MTDFNNGDTDPRGERSMSSEIELKPCPFCGGEAKPFRHQAMGEDGWRPPFLYGVACSECPTIIKSRHVARTEADMAELWNRRTPPSSAAGDVRCGNERYELDAYIWRRESTQEWVFEISGAINGTAFISRHVEPLTTPPEDVAGLPSLYDTRPQPASDASGEVERLANNLEFLASKHDGPGGICRVPQYTINEAAALLRTLSRALLAASDEKDYG